MSPTELSHFFCPTAIHIGVGSYRKITDSLRRWNVSRLMVLLDAALLKSGFYADIEALLKEEVEHYDIYTDIEPDPSAHTVDKAYTACRASGATVLLAIGGGSTIDVAKAVGILATNGGKIHDYEGIEKFSTPPLPLIAIPTTAGTGSEVSGSCVITDTEKNLKMSIRHASMNPADVAILDPLALRTVPAHVAAHSGLDAFVHAFESYISRQANPFTDAINLHALTLISGSIRQFTANRNNLSASLDMLCGSALAGMAFGQTGLGNVHCMARFVGAYFHLSHGFSNALCLPHVAAFNLPANPAKYAKIAQAMGEHVQGMPERLAAHKALESIGALCSDLDIPSRLRDAGVQEDKLDDMAKHCVGANYNRWNPRDTSLHDFQRLFRDAF